MINDARVAFGEFVADEKSTDVVCAAWEEYYKQALGSKVEVVCMFKIAQGSNLDCPPWRRTALHRERCSETVRKFEF